MSILKKIILLGFITLLPATVSLAQTKWSVLKNDVVGDLVAVFFTTSERGFVAGDKGYLASTGDGGRNWAKQTIDTTDDINEIYFRNDNNGYIVAGKKMFSTSDGGRSWQEIKIYNPKDFKNAAPEFLSVRFADKKRGIVVGSLVNKDDEVVDSIVMRTDNGGETWQRIVVPSKRELYHLDFTDSSRGWIVGDKGLILVTYNGGFDWQTQQSGTDKALYNVDFRDKDNGFAVGGKGTILRTENGGETWTAVKTAFSNTFLRVNFTDDKNGFVVGNGGTILYSADKGRVWTKQESETKSNLYGLFMNKKYGWAVGAKGSVIKYQR